MISPTDCSNKYGHPVNEAKWMVLFDVPAELEIGVIPKRIYCNRDLVEPIKKAFKNLIDTGRVSELKTWDGCFNPRPVRGYEKKYAALMRQGKKTEALKYLSIHSWGVAIDVNAAWNGLGVVPKLSAEFVKCFTDAGFDWGGHWQRLDGMHFQLSSIK